MTFTERSPRAVALAKTDYGTPVDLYQRLDAAFTFTVDLAAHAGNAKHRRYYDLAKDSLRQSWEGETGFLNPPYGRGVDPWLDKARHSAMRERAVIVQLLPARVGTKWWRKYIETGDGAAGRLRQTLWVPETRVLWLRWDGLVTGIQYLSERVQFEGAEDAAKFDAAVVIHASPNRPAPFTSKSPEHLTYGWPR